MAGKAGLGYNIGRGQRRIVVIQVKHGDVPQEARRSMIAVD
jgi:hypothetical protein